MNNNHSYEIFCDSLQEGIWFKNLHSDFRNADLRVIPNSKKEQKKLGIDRVLQYDRPDIVLKDRNQVIFVLERTVEVPSGHNVGQRFGRLVAAAKERIPVVYFGPYAAYKHGGATAGPRYMNLRLFYSLHNVSKFYSTAITTINWPVDAHYEVLKTPKKDCRLREYMQLFLNYYNTYAMNGLTEYIKDSSFQRQQYKEQIDFANNEIRNPEQYNSPPDSVKIMSVSKFERDYCKLPILQKNISKIELYHVGMQNIRSDPYTGMAALYHYLYFSNNLIQILHFPNIEFSEWLSLKPKTKTYRMYKEFCAAILFSDSLVFQEDL